MQESILILYVTYLNEQHMNDELINSVQMDTSGGFIPECVYRKLILIYIRIVVKVYKLHGN